MEQSSLNAGWKKEQDKLVFSENQIKGVLENLTLPESDRVRLTRVIQIIDKYKPERALPPEKAEELTRLRKILSFLIKQVPRRKVKQVPEPVIPPDELSARSYVLAEEAIATLRQLRSIDFSLDTQNVFSEESVLNQERGGEVIGNEVLDTSLTLDYERKNWGVERICLDGIQNHLPEDSKGEHVWVQCLVDGQWVSLQEAKEHSEKIQSVRFVDDGVGFDARNLSLLYSTKSDEANSAGQFGEGMKMIAAASLREGIDLELESQGWRARPFAKEVVIKDTRHGQDKVVQQLSFRVEHLSGDPMIGSRTTIWKPTKKFIDELLMLDAKVLAVREHYTSLFSSQFGEIVDREPGNIFVKGIFVCKNDTLLSYNFNDVETNRDRNVIVNDSVGNKIGQILEELNNRHIIKALLKRSLLNKAAIESNLWNINLKYPDLWRESFYEAFGRDTVLDTGFVIPQGFHGDLPPKVRFPQGIHRILIKAGVKADREVIPDFYQDVIPTSITLEYGKEVWDEERIMLDAVQNHLPHDSGGSFVGLRFKTKDGQWFDYSSLGNFTDDQIEAIRIFDNGRGYDSQLLGLFQSVKDHSESSGKFGEGIKMLSAAALRQGVRMELSSRDWVAAPRAEVKMIDGQEIHQLVFDVTEYIKSDIKNDDTSIYYQSATTFYTPSKELLEEFRVLPRKVLAIERKTPLVTTFEGDLLSDEGGMLFVRQILIPGNHHLAFTYHLPHFEIKNRDRNTVDLDEVGKVVANILSATESTQVIRSYLTKALLAVQNIKDLSLEFKHAFIPKSPEIWKSQFQALFGENVAIRDVESQDFDAFHQNMHLGLTLITVPSAVYKTLEALGLPTYESRLMEMTDVIHINPEGLTAEEREVIETLYQLEKYLLGNRDSEIVIYEPKYPGQHVARGFADGIKIHLDRRILGNIFEAADVHIHEKVHHNTRGTDASPEYRNYLTLALSKVLLDLIGKGK